MTTFFKPFYVCTPLCPQHRPTVTLHSLSLQKHSLSHLRPNKIYYSVLLLLLSVNYYIFSFFLSRSVCIFLSLSVFCTILSLASEHLIVIFFSHSTFRYTFFHYIVSAVPRYFSCNNNGTKVFFITVNLIKYLNQVIILLFLNFIIISSWWVN